MNRHVITSVGSLFIVLGVALNAQANGYKILCVKDARSIGMAEAVVAQPSDPAAVSFNPAGLADLRGNAVSANATAMTSYTTRKSATGEETDMNDRWQTVPAFFATSDFGLKQLAFGLGITLPNGLSSEWAENSFARYVATYSDLMVADIAVAAGGRINDSLAVGVSASYYFSRARLERMADLGLAGGAPGMMDARSVLKGDGSTWGASAGLLYTLNKRNAFGLTYKLPFSIDYDGEWNMAGMQSDAEATFDFPASVVLGYMFKPTDKLSLELDADWTHWSDVGDISIDFKTPGMADATMEQRFLNTIAWKLGAEYKYSEDVTLRAGYIYNRNATPDETWRPSMPDTDVHFLTAGAGYRMDRLTLNGAVQLVFYEKRNIDNNVDMNEFTSSSTIDGEYRTFAPCVTLGATYAF